MANYKSLQLADALQRVSAQLKPEVTTGRLTDTALVGRTAAPDPSHQWDSLYKQADQYMAGLS